MAAYPEFRAVDAVSFRLRRASTLAIVGESGSGKSTLARMVLGLLQPTSGTVVFDGTPIADATGPGHDVGFSPARAAGVPESLQQFGSHVLGVSCHRGTVADPSVGDRKQREQAVRELVDQVALPSSVLSRLPRELSGGQRQRVAIARALALRPEVLVCDEAVSALDVLVQAQILDLLASCRPNWA